MGQGQALALLFAASAIGCAVATAILWRRRRSTPAAAAMTLTMVAIAEWSAAKMLGTLAAGLPAKVLFESAIYPGVCACVAGFFCYCLAMADRAWTLSRRTAVLLAAEPVLVVAAVATNPWHGLFYADLRLTGAPPLLVPSPGPLFWVHTAYSYGLLALAVLTLLRAYVQAPGTYRRQFVWPLAALVPPMAANVVTVALMPQGRTVGLTPLFFTLSAAACCWALFRRALPDLVPVAGRQILETISDAVIVVDRSLRVLELNPAADRLLRTLQPDVPAEVVGLPAGAVMGIDRVLAAGRDGEYTVTTPDGRPVDLSIRVSELSDRAGRMIGWVLVAHDVTQAKRTTAELREQLDAVERLRAELAELAVRDTLTGLHNRRHLIDTLDRELSRGVPVSLVMVDIDRFKAINDRYGHAAGDVVIVATARLLAAGVADGETVARYGGEEFVLVLPGCTAAQARRRTEALRERCAAMPVALGCGDAVTVTFSAGVAEAAGSGPAALIDAADRALYAAKTLGRNRVEAASAHSEAAAAGR